MPRRPVVHPPAPWSYPVAREHRLTNGIRVLTHQVPGQRVISAILILDIPLTVEDAMHEGVATTVARVLDEGSEHYPGDRFAEVLETEGAALGAHQGLSGLRVMLDVPETRFPAAFSLLAEAVRRPEIRAADVTRHVALRLAELDQMKANSAQLASWAFPGTVLDPTVRAARLAGGEPESVARITPEAAQDFHRLHYGPAGATLVLAGDFSADPVALAEAGFGDWTNPDQMSGSHQRAASAPPRAVLLDRPGSVQADLRFGGFGIDRHDPRWSDYQVGTYAVGGAFLSRLNKVLREERGFTYGVGLQNSPLRNGGTYAVSGSFRTEVVAPALVEARALLDITDAPITAAEVAEAVDYFAGVSPLRYATADGLADQTASLVIQDLPVDYVDRYLEGIRKATPESASRAYADVLDLDALSLVVVGDAERLTGPLQEAGIAVEVR